MTQPRKRSLTPPPTPAAGLEAKAIYGAMVWASSDSCTCQSCIILRRLYKKVACQIAEAAIAELDEEKA